MGNLTAEAAPTRKQAPVGARPPLKTNATNSATIDLAKALLPASRDSAARLGGQVLAGLNLG